MNRKARGTIDHPASKRRGRRIVEPVRREAPQRLSGSFYLGLAAIVIAGAALRLLAARGELWLDEIWSYRVAHLVDLPGVFTGIHSDNNHYLNTLFLRLIPIGTADWFVYRLPSVIAGTGSILLAAAIARQAGERAALAAAAFTAGSFLLVVYSSEARGYALAIFCAFACLWLAQRQMAAPRAWRAASLSILATAGLLAHLTFLHALAGLATWTAVRAYRQTAWLSALSTLASLYALPAAALVILYVVDLRHLELGGGPASSSWTIAANALALSVGGPETGPVHAIAVAAAAMACVAAILTIRRSGSDIWLLFLVTIVIAPAVTLALVETNVIYERYLLVAISFLTLSFGWLAGAVFRRSPAAGTILVILLLAGNVSRAWELIERGRGSFMPAMAHAVRHAVQRPVTIGSDHDFRIGRVVEFYRPFVTGGDAIDYVEQPAWPIVGPEWLLRHRIEPEFHPESEITVLHGARYRLVATYPYAGVSGWHMALYHNVLALGR